jgi:hypothetical protein
VRALYRSALAGASFAPVFSVEGGHEGVLVRPVIFGEAVLAVLVNDSSRDASLAFSWNPTGTTLRARVAAGSAGCVLARRRDFAEISRWSAPARGS